MTEFVYCFSMGKSALCWHFQYIPTTYLVLSTYFVNVHILHSDVDDVFELISWNNINYKSFQKCNFKKSTEALFEVDEVAFRSKNLLCFNIFPLFFFCPKLLRLNISRFKNGVEWPILESRVNLPITIRSYFSFIPNQSRSYFLQ